MHRSSLKKLVTRPLINSRKAKIKLVLKKPRAASFKGSKPTLTNHGALAIPAAKASAHSKPEPRFLSETILTNTEQWLGTFKSQSGADLTEKMKDLVRLAREQGYLT